MIARAVSTASRLEQEVARLVAHPRAPLVVLVLVLLYALGARVFYLGEPCSQPCTKGTDHTLIFDEAYYVNAARVIDGIRPPAHAAYHTAPLGMDPNAEHPQLAKVIIAGTIKLFGDNPWGWRAGSVLFGMLALLALYALVRAAGGSRWLAVGATAVMALDNLALVQSRIGLLDIYALALMLVAATLYVRRSPLAAGLVLGVAAGMKEVAVYLLAALLVLEAFRAARDRRERPLRESVRPLLLCGGATAISFLALLWILDIAIPAYDPGRHVTYGGSPFTHLAHIVSYGLALRQIPHATGISSTPWDWLVNDKPINYARVAVNSVSGGTITASRALVDFRGEMNPFIIFLALPALATAAADAWSRRDEVATVALAWSVGTFVPFVFQSTISHRISYIFYMLIVLPGVYIATTKLFARRGMPVAATIGWAIALVYGFAHLYPVRTLSGH